MADDSFNIGSDATITWLVNGLPFSTVRLTEFTAKQVTTDLESVPINGKTTYRKRPKGWEISMKWDRTNSSGDDMFAAEEANFYNGAQPSQMVIAETIRNPDGSVSKYRYDGVSLKFDDAGSKSGEAKVTQSVSGNASTRVKVQ